MIRRLGSRRAGEAAAAALVLAAAIALPFWAPTFYVQLASKVLAMGLLAMALNLAVGFGGMVSMCHGAFFGLAGYVLALASPRYEPASLWLTLPLATGAASLAALVIGALSLRTRGVYFIMVTLAFGQMLFFLFADTDIAGGSDGFYIYNKPDTGIAGLMALDLEKPRNFYLVTLAIVAASALLLIRLTRSPFGEALTAARDNERRARSLGFPVYRIRLLAFTISGAFAGIAGYLAAAQYGFVAPQMLGWHLSATVLVMVVLGGLGSVLGPLAGAIVLMGMEEVLKSLTPYWAIVMGGIIIAIVLTLPGGVRQLAALVLDGPGRPGRARDPAPAAGDPRHA